ncbi:prolactin receptor b [Oncorhynchus kisutch]|uniref:Prolactin receptor n=1 Tax=Oncorhynchus kisutch TaxID=8019 RepID=A0A8C7MDZ2_ONCKI|nr:prolactin receptor [Oncorhynchus kisutch]
MWGEVGGALVLLLLSEVLDCIGISPPGKPVLINCRSPEKETFTCRWDPGFDGGLPTTHHLYYQKEDSYGMYECPDYQAAGSNSCFFNKSHTSIWVNYNITVVAINSLGSTVSDPLEVDVMYIVQPNAPENVTVSVVETEESPHLLVKWEPPHEADTRSGWITLTYQLRVKRQNKKESEWEEYASGKQTQLIIYSLHPGEVYMVQLRCKLDHSLWSEWSTTTHTEVPDYFLKERSIWIVVTVFSAFIILLVTFTLAMKRKYVKHCLLPPVPGPKISGLDTQLLKSGRSEDILSSLINQGFPPTIATKDQQVDYLLVFDSEQVTPDLQNGQTRTNNSIDHGCYDHSLLMEANNKEVKVGGRETVEQGYSEGLESTFRKTKSLSTDITSHPYPQKKPFNNVTETPKQAPVSSKYRSLSHHKDLWDSLARHLDYRETVVKSQSNCDDKHLSSQNNVTPSKAIGCVEVQRWTKSIGLQVLVPKMDKRQEDYSKVSVVENDNVVLLKRETVPLNCTSCKVGGNQSEKCLQQKPCKPNMTVPAKEGVHIGSNGYVEPVTHFIKM